ncbi:hypothetical protein [Slackia heliotrinireducens]|uniref:hypothetical protein n=1 Tax=Slackia heliotrinireducens TaxID=84110 RepID=UPI0011AE6DEC|nr:hypothetical protein [Slackia heliotrinireducens]
MLDFAQPCGQDWDGMVEECRYLGIEGKVDILVKDPNDRRWGSSVNTHVCKADLPVGSFVSLGDGLQVCAPELVFVQMAQELTFVQLVALGFELCGSYCQVDSVDEKYELPPVLTAARLNNYIDKLKNVQGLTLARRAAAFVLDCSASFLETGSTMSFYLPHRYGGYGYGTPRLNCKIVNESPQPGEAPDYRCDICYPEHKLVMEANGKGYHAGAACDDDDIEKMAALERMGYKVVVITWERLKDPFILHKTAVDVAKAMGRRTPDDGFCLGPEQRRLRAELFGW